VIRLPSSADLETVDEATVVDQARTALLEALQADLADALVEHVLVPGVDLTVRLTTDSWGDTAEYLREGQRFRFFDFLSAIDWMPSPFGRSMDAAVDEDDNAEEAETAELVTGLAGGDTRFQVFARVFSLTTNIGLTLKADVGDDMTVGSWVDTYPGAEWHEREAWEMFGINFAGHPGLRPLYLPTDFEGHPMRKDFPLLARLIKPWPGIVDVEPMPEDEEPQAPSTENVEAAQDPAPTAGVVETPDTDSESTSSDSDSSAEADPASTSDPAPAAAAETPAAPAEAPAKPSGGEATDTSGIPEHLLKRSREAKGDAS
jgi:NADH-quinone oxidoreductase subunit C